MKSVVKTRERQSLRLALAQINSTVGDFPGNVRKILDWMGQAKEQEADLVAFPELALTGYSPEDLLLQSHFVRENLRALQQIVAKCSGIAAIIGYVDQKGTALYNAAAVIDEQTIQGVYHKCCLPNYSVFDEARYFQVGTATPATIFVVNGISVGVSICEDIWYADGPAHTQAVVGEAQLLVNISASPYRMGVSDIREKMLATRAKETVAMIAYVNMVGGQDELIFDGQSLLFNEKGERLLRAKPFQEVLVVADLPFQGVSRARQHDPLWRKRERRNRSDSVRTFCLTGPKQKKKMKILPAVSRSVRKLSLPEEIYKALVLGVSDYVQKNGFKKAAVALSGGIDSALTAVIAVDALGAHQVIGVFMPSRYTSKESIEDTEKLAKNIGIKLINLPIEKTFEAYLSSLSETFRGYPNDQTEENLQSRIRGSMMMALSNKFGWLVLATGNKSEMSVGYATLYGDMAGGFAVIKDLWKSVVYQLARFRNKKKDGKGGGVIPKRILTRPPTAELRPHQRDQDTLPPYEEMDPILKAYIEEDLSLDEIVARGFDLATVARVTAWVDRSEFKRRQAPVGIKITPRAFGKDRRMPIANLYSSVYPTEK